MCECDDVHRLCDNHVDIMSVLKDMIDVRDGLKMHDHFNTASNHMNYIPHHNV